MREHIPLITKVNPLWIIFGSLFLLIIPFLIWSQFATLDQISHAEGQVIATAKTQEIQAASDGVIEQIYVREGQHVKEGQRLILLEQDKAKAGYDESRSKVAALKATLIRLQAEVFDKPLVFPDELKGYPEFISNQTELFKRRQQAIRDQTTAINESLALAEEELQNNLPLLKTGDIGSAEIIKLKRQIADLKGKLSNVQNKYFQDSQTDMTKAEEELSMKEQELADKKITLEWTDIRSPMDAIVKNILVTTKGARVRAGDVIMQLVPFGDKLIIEAKLPTSDVSFVEKGQKVAVKLDAYDYSIYGIFDGEVAYISPDTLVEKTEKGEKYYFKVKVILNDTTLIAKNGRRIDVSPGMTTQIDIITGERTVWQYITKPITKTMNEAFGER
ncbi:HlyD family efflux transporter periplasmic adaptor subunit [Sulfurovum sp.]|jgi:multidrug efflux pump subunit AcrA (membrane-fusion protein)|uniref:HlyD family efflux transporter periplasmic adaptor subunit n=1 Tax=Sulfurovum sp. TaxID=1969726 RepID=UPI002A361234|nr:HlyD family efflux transporter periplasmic adaptor subunit [Sulfurovum sp.]MDY0403061.1 HlyD family efflux transporter periplasmic adaptor subunit [Sulfurovum sp.]